VPPIPGVWHRAGGRQFRRRLQAGDLGQGHRPSGRAGPNGAAYCAVAQDCFGSDCFGPATCAAWRSAKAQDLRHEAICGAGRADGWVASNVTGSLSTAAGSLLSTAAGSLGVIAAAGSLVSTAAGVIAAASSLGVIARGFAGAATDAAQRWRQQGGNRQRW
jgi:hypothetical protein